MDFDQVTGDHIIKGIRDYNEKGLPNGFGPSSTYDLVYKGKTYPPKAIMAYANFHAVGRKIERYFKGGIDTDCFKAFERNGFNLVKKANRVMNEKLYQLKDEFLKMWPIERLKTMSLEEYTNLDKEDSFCYWLEVKTTDLGSVWGGSAYKFGIFKRKDLSSDNYNDKRKSDGEYAWYGKYGDSRGKVFEKVRSIIVDIATNSQQNELKNIEDIDLGDAVKWKIAFLYGDFNVINVFTHYGLKTIAEYFGYEGNDRSYVTLNEFVLSQKGDKDYFDFAKELWKKLDSPDETILKDIMESKENFNDEALNQILYGPPGTGKTYKLREKYFDMFTISESTLSKEQFITNLVADLTWWQVFAIALCDSGKTSVNQLLGHEIVKAKASLSNAKNFRPIAWSTMQAHSVPECPHVNVADSSEPSLFYKEADSEWRVVKENVENLYPEGIELLERINNFEPSADKTIKNYEFVTFHQSFSYEDFVEGIKPKLEEGNSKLEYEINDGIFKKLCQKAEKDLENNYAIFIDEINRGNVSAIFGELITLIEDDKRIGKPQELRVKLPYSKNESFGVPPNLYIIGTMNTADRSVEALDTALRRRFVFEEVMPKPSLLSEIEFDGFNLEEVLETINTRIEALLDRDHTIGHSYFIKLESGDTNGLLNVFKNNIIPLLQEYFYADYEKIALVLGNGFVKEKAAHKDLFPKIKNLDIPELGTSYELISPIEDIEQGVIELLNKSNE